MRILPILLILASAAFAQQRIAILNTEDDGEPPLKQTELNYLTDRQREIAGSALKGRYGIMTQQSIVDKLGSRETAAKACKEATCLADLGRKLSANYVAQARIGRFGGSFTIKAELYNSMSGLQVATITGSSKNIQGLLAVLDEKAPAMFAEMLGPAKGPVEGGISGVRSAGGGYEFDGERRHVASISTEPAGALLSFDGAADARCLKAPCKIELPEGDVRIVASLDRHERADTTVSISGSGQGVIIRLRPSFGTLEVKPAYVDGIGRGEAWSMSINGAAAAAWKSALSPGKHKVELKHRCYEDLSFEAGIARGGTESFDMAGHIQPKMGGLILSAIRGGEPASLAVFVNGKPAGSAPFGGSVPVCSEIEIGSGGGRKSIGVKLKHNEKVRYTYVAKEEDGYGGEEEDYYADSEEFESERGVWWKESQKEPAKPGFWAALGLGAAGAAFIIGGYSYDKDAVKSFKEYSAFGRGYGEYDYRDARDKTKKAAGTRNIMYTLGGIFLAAGIGVYIWF